LPAISTLVRTLTVLALAATSSACVRLGPQTLEQDRFDYTGAVGESRKEQILTALVRMRYVDWPSFIAIEQIVTSYTWEQAGAAKAIIRSPLSGTYNQGELGYTGKYQERPTVVFKPLGGKKFTNTILTPPDPAAIFALIETGWPADDLFRIAVESVNGKENSHPEEGKEHRADIAFADFVRLLRKLQRLNALDVDFLQKSSSGAGPTVAENLTPGSARTQLTIDMPELDDATLEEVEHVKEQLGLNPATYSFQIKWGSKGGDPDTIFVQTRFLLQVLSALTPSIDVPEADLKAGSAMPLSPTPELDLSGFQRLMHVHSSETAPPNAFISVRYRDHDFWISDNDIKSKQTFSYLSLMLSVTESGDAQGAAQLVIPTN
jgi:hypothetical protein